MNNERYAFRTEWFDSHAELYRQYEFFYYPFDSSVEMYDIKQKRTFLKRTKSNLKMADLFIGASVNVQSRQLLIKDYADEYTRKNLVTKTESTMLIVKPGGLKGLGMVIDQLQKSKFTICTLRYLNFNDHLEVLSGIDARDLSNGICAAIEVLRSNAVYILNELVNTEFKGMNMSGLLYTPSTFADGQVILKSVFESGRTFKRSATFKNCTLSIIKPHALINGSAGKIIQDIINAGFHITDAELFRIDTQNAEDFLEVYRGVLPDYHLMLSQLTAGPLIAMEICGDGVVPKFRAFCGPSDVELAKQVSQNSLRAKYGEDKIKNAVHCTDLEDDGVLESEFFFKIL